MWERLCFSMLASLCLDRVDRIVSAARFGSTLGTCTAERRSTARLFAIALALFFRADTSRVHARLTVKSYVSSSYQHQPVAQDENLRRITVSNDDGDVYVESSGDGSEIVLKTEKVRITDGDVYCGTSNVGLSARIDALKTKDDALDALDERIATLNDTQVELRDDLDRLETTTSGRLSHIDGRIDSLNVSTTTLTPPRCMPPGGDKLRFDGTNWLCVCLDNWSGLTCETPPSPPPSPPPPSPMPPHVTPPPSPPPKPPSPPPLPRPQNDMLRLAISECLQKEQYGACVCDTASPCGDHTGGNISTYDTSEVTDFSNLFLGTGFNYDLSRWNTTSVTAMDGMFRKSTFNQEIGDWDVSHVTSMSYMFYEASAFNKPIGRWNVAGVQNMEGMFAGYAHVGGAAFNQAIGEWNVARVSNMKSMFESNFLFDKPIGDWNTTSVTAMDGMFRKSTFNQEIGDWDVSHVTSMSYMFYEASAFNKPIGRWNVAGVQNMEGMFARNVAFNQQISSWDVLQVRNMREMFSDSAFMQPGIIYWKTHPSVESYEMFAESRFASTFECPNNRDGPPSACSVAPISTPFALTQAVAACFEEADDGDCTCTDSCGEAGLHITYWNTFQITRMHELFANKSLFNQPLLWDTSAVTRFERMFQGASSFNQNISGWTTSLAADMSNMFEGASAFAYDLKQWELPENANTRNMFKDATSFQARFLCDDANDGPPSTCEYK